MNQKYIVGVGNIYASEALFMSGIHPSRLGKDITKRDCEKLVRAIKSVLKKIYKIRRFKHKRSYDGFWKDGVFSK